MQNVFLLFFLSVIFLLSFSAGAQSFEGYPGFGVFTPEDVSLKQVDFDKDANAVIIHDLARSEYTDERSVITEHRVRIKILTEKGIDEANIVIPFYSKDQFEYLSGIDAVIRTYEPNGQFSTEKLNQKAVFTKKMNEFYSETRFTLPNVKAGSIFEYTYFSNKKQYDLDDWDFQSDLPTITSYYRVAILPIAEFAYKVYKLPDFPIEIKKPAEGSVSFKMTNIPALHEEAYMDSRRDNLQRVSFQLSAYNVSGYKQKFINSWDEAAKELLLSPSLGGQLNRNLAGTDDFIKQTKAMPDATDRVKAVLELVKQKMSWNGFSSKYTVDGIKKAWEKGNGTNGEINLIFVNLLNEVNVTACPLLANDRDRGKIDINYPFIDQFQKVVTYVTLPEKNLIIDASDRVTPLHMVPYNLLNTFGYKVDKKNKGLMILEDDKRYYDNSILVNATLSPEGILNGFVVNQSSDYSRLERVQQYKKLGAPKFTETYFTENLTNLKADSLTVTGLDNDSLPFRQQLSFSQTLNTSGDYTFLNYHLFTGLDKNPFTNDVRFSDINFGSPQRYTVSQTIFLPENYQVDALPKNINLITRDTAFRLTRVIKEEKGVLLISFKLDINRSFFDREDYEMLQAFYKKMHSLLSEQIVLKRKA